MGDEGVRACRPAEILELVGQRAHSVRRVVDAALALAARVLLARDTRRPASVPV
jgi:hypothetical protein